MSIDAEFFSHIGWCFISSTRLATRLRKGCAWVMFITPKRRNPEGEGSSHLLAPTYHIQEGQKKDAMDGILAAAHEAFVVLAGFPKGLSGEVVAMEWCPTMDLLAIATSDSQVSVYRVTWQRLFAISTSQPVHCVAWRPDGQQLAVGTADGAVALYNVEVRSRRPRATLGARRTAQPHRVDPSPAGAHAGRRTAVQLQRAQLRAADGRVGACLLRGPGQPRRREASRWFQSVTLSSV